MLATKGRLSTPLTTDLWSRMYPPSPQPTPHEFFIFTFPSASYPTTTTMWFGVGGVLVRLPVKVNAALPEYNPPL